MVVNVYSVFDVKSEVFHMPFYAHNVKDGMRMFHRMLTTNEVYKGYEEDYRLYHLGTFDDKLGVISSTENGKASFVISAYDTLGKKASDEQ